MKVEVHVLCLAIDLNGKEQVFHQGDVFDCPPDRIERLGNSVKTISPAPDPEINPDETKTEKPTVSVTTPQKRPVKKRR